MLDRAEEICERYGRVVLERPEGTSPASALQVLAEEDIDRYRHADLTLAPGEFPALWLESSALRRFALDAREQHVDTVSAAIITTCPTVHSVVARAHAAALISVIQTITDQIGTHVLRGGRPNAPAQAMMSTVRIAFGDLDCSFHAITLRSASGVPAPQ